MQTTDILYDYYFIKIVNSNCSQSTSLCDNFKYNVWLSDPDEVSI